MAQRYYYSSGLYASNWTEGPSTSGIDNFDYTVAGSSLKLDGSGGASEWATIRSNSSFDLTNWSNLTAKYSYIASNNPAGSTAFFAISTSGDASYSAGFETLFIEHAINNITTESVDVSSYNGYYYLYFGLKTTGKPGSTHLDLQYVLVTGDPGDGYFDNSGYVGTYNTPLLNIYCDSICNLDAASGVVRVTGQGLTSYSRGYVEGNPYGRLTSVLNNIIPEAYTNATILGTGAQTLQRMGVTSFAANTGTNFGSLNTRSSLSNLGVISTGNATITYAGYFNNTLSNITSITSGTVPEHQYAFKFTKESKKFIGRSCHILDLETVNNKIDSSCISIVKSYPVQIDLSKTQYNIVSCNCTANIPIYLNRVHNQNVTLNLATSQYSSPISISGVSIRPSVSGQDYTHTSGTLTIPSGSLYANFSIPIIEYTGDNVTNVFKLQYISGTSDNICQQSYYTNIVILPTGS